MLFPDGLSFKIAVLFYATAVLLALYAGSVWLRQRSLAGSSWPGVTAYLLVRVREGQEKRRRYLFDQFKSDGAAIALYLSASDIFTFAVSDVNGEVYSIESGLGRTGIPLVQWIHLVAEVAQRRTKTVLSLSINGDVICQRTLSFHVSLGDGGWGKMGTLASDRDGQNNGKLDIGAFLIRSPTLSRNEKQQLTSYYEKKWNLIED